MESKYSASELEAFTQPQRVALLRLYNNMDAAAKNFNYEAERADVYPRIQAEATDEFYEACVGSPFVAEHHIRWFTLTLNRMKLTEENTALHKERLASYDAKLSAARTAYANFDPSQY